MIKNIIAFAAGGLLGGGIAYLVLQNKFEKKYEEDTKDVKEKYEESLKELKEALNKVEETSKSLKDKEESNHLLCMRNPSEHRRFVRERTNYDKLHEATDVPDLGGTGVERGSRFLDASSKSEGSGEREVGDPGGPTDEDPATDPEERWDQEEENARKLYEEGRRETEERAANRGKPPKIISEADFWNKYPQYDAQTLMYYTEDDVLATEEDEEIYDVGMTIGDALERYGFIDNDEKEIFVVNPRIGCRFQIQKVWGAYADIKRV